MKNSVSSKMIYFEILMQIFVDFNKLGISKLVSELNLDF
jgi:hypothetical protein